VEATVRYAAELGYEVTVVRRRSSRITRMRKMHAALDVNIPNYAIAVGRPPRRSSVTIASP
jgi:hypothetical protein